MEYAAIIGYFPGAVGITFVTARRAILEVVIKSSFLKLFSFKVRAREVPKIRPYCDLKPRPNLDLIRSKKGRVMCLFNRGEPV